MSHPMYTIPRLRALRKDMTTAVARNYIKCLIDGHPDTVCDAIWAEMITAEEGR